MAIWPPLVAPASTVTVTSQVDGPPASESLPIVVSTSPLPRTRVPSSSDPAGQEAEAFAPIRKPEAQDVSSTQKSVGTAHKMSTLAAADSLPGSVMVAESDKEVVKRRSRESEPPDVLLAPKSAKESSMPL